VTKIALFVEGGVSHRIRSNQWYGDVDSDGVLVRPPFLFILDRHKGLKPTLKAVFPDKYKLSCTKHIKANLVQKFGKQCARYYLCAIAKTYATRHSSCLSDEVQNVKTEAVKYLEDISNAGGCALAEHSGSGTACHQQICHQYMGL
jgi:hypothetical protein